MVGKTRHGHTWAGGFSKTYSAWGNMHSRCRRRKKDPSTKYWRGIVICERWFLFDNFLADMGVKPEGMTLDRIDSKKGYDPENCRWVSRTIQSRNTKRRKDNTTGIRGVGRRELANKVIWRAYIGVKGLNVNLGAFDTIEEAAAARKAAEDKYWGDER